MNIYFNDFNDVITSGDRLIAYLLRNLRYTMPKTIVEIRTSRGIKSYTLKDEYNIVDTRDTNYICPYGKFECKYIKDKKGNLERIVCTQI